MPERELSFFQLNHNCRSCSLADGVLFFLACCLVSGFKRASNTTSTYLFFLLHKMP